MAGVHGLEHVEGLGAPDLTHDDAVGPHAQGVAHEVADADLARALGVGRPGLEVDHMRLLELKLGGVLDGDDALAVGDERRQHVEVRRLAGAGAARDQDVELGPDAGLQHHRQVEGEGAEVDEVLHREGVGGELPDRQHRAVDGEGRDDGVDTRAVGEAGVDHR